MTDNQINSMFEALQKRIDALDKKYDSISMVDRGNINAITPYVESKTAYIDDEYVTFDIAKDGIISVYMVDNDGQNVPCMFERMANEQIRVSFAKRDSLATVTISIQ